MPSICNIPGLRKVGRMRRITGLFISLVVVSTQLGVAASGDLVVEFDKQGIASVKYQNKEFLGLNGQNPKGEAVASVWFRGEGKQHYEKPPPVEWTDPRTAVRKYSWGTCTVRYKVASDQLDADVEFQNDPSGKTIEQAQCDLFYIKFPNDVTPLRWNNADPPKNCDTSGPTALIADFGAGKIVTVAPHTGVPICVRWGSKQAVGYQLSLYTATTIEPGASIHMSVSCRFCSKQEQVDAVAADAYKSFRELHPPLLQWTDRRPVGALMLAKSNMKWSTNPRGWLDAPRLNVFTNSGRAQFRSLIMQRADSCLSNMRKMHAQGVIVWDIEGAQYPQGEATYVGDPRLLKRVAPEMDTIADDLFNKFRRAGFRVGVCLRADAVNFRPNGSFYQKPFTKEEELFRSLDERINYARSRWGCTLYYIDSYTGTHAYTPVVLKRLLRKYPDVLLIPEFEQTLSYAYSAPYKELRPMGKNPGTASTPERALKLYPQAFTVINTADGDLVRRRAELVNSVRRGDVLLFRAWWGDQGFDRARSIYDEATKR
jgi:hypothetical protein